MQSIFKYPEIIDAFVESLFRNTEKYDVELGRRFFITRTEDSEFLDARLSNANEFGGNVLVVGEPGIGKSSFITWFLKAWGSKNSGTNNKVSLLDLRQTPYNQESPKEFLDLIADHISEVVKTHLDHLRVTKTVDAHFTVITDGAGYNKTMQKLVDLPQPYRNPSVVHYLFVDDVDYLPSGVFVQFLELLKPLLLSRYFCVILACRVPAHNTIKSHRDFNICRAFEDSTTLCLRPIPVNDILRARFAILTQDGRSFRSVFPKLQWLAQSLRGLFSVLEKTFQQLPVGEDIEIFSYPFTEKQHAFMRGVSNGNIRIVLQIAKEYLTYMRNNESRLKPMEQGFFVGRDAVVDYFSHANLDEKVRLINLHEKSTYQHNRESTLKKRGVMPEHIGNSVYVLVLEAYKQFAPPHHIDAGYVRMLNEEYGLDEQTFYEATQELVSLDMIRERCLEARAPLGVKIGSKDFDLTDKGSYYLEYLIHWDSYIRHFGVSKHHELLRTVDAKRALEHALIIFSGNIYTYRVKTMSDGGNFIVDKAVFRDNFVKFNSDLLFQLDETDKNTKPKIETKELDIYLSERLRLSKPKKSPRDSFYYFDGGEIMSQLRESGYSGLELRGIYDENVFGKFVATFTMKNLPNKGVK